VSGLGTMKVGDDRRDPLVSDRERKEAERAALGQNVGWAAEERMEKRSPECRTGLPDVGSKATTARIVGGVRGAAADFRLQAESLDGSKEKGKREG
jgi:hypothetical protein